jgi:hypothetical protein
LKARILLTLVLACSISSCTQKWVPVATGVEKKTEVLVDVSSVRVTDDIRTASVKTLFAPHSQKGFGSNANKYGSYLLTREAFNCGKKTFRLEAVAIYYEDGTKDSVPAERMSTETWQPVAPGKLHDGELQFVCAWKST